MKNKPIPVILFLLVFLMLPIIGFGQTAEEVKALEKAIQNPIAAMISLPFQNNTDFGLGAGKLFKIGKQAFHAQAGYYYFVVAPDNGPDWELRFQLNLLFPKKK